MHARSGGVDPGRDGCRVPLPVVGRRAAVRLQRRRGASTPWLPQPADWAGLTAQAQAGDPRLDARRCTARRSGCAASTPTSATAR